MSADPYLNAEDGTPLYVRSESSWGRTSESLRPAANLAEAKARFGWTRMQHTFISVRRARQSDAHLYREAAE